jgi:sugar phosphate isomerase/epimerase
VIGKLGITTYACFWAIRGPNDPKQAAITTAFALLERAHELGAEVVQLCENLPLGGLSANGLRQLRAAASQNNITLEVGMRGIEPRDIKRSLRLAALLGSSILRIVPWAGMPERRALKPERLVRAIKPILPLARDYGIALAIENYFDITDGDLARAIADLNDPLAGVTLDTANSVGCIQEPLETITALLPHALSLHVKDFTVLKTFTGYTIAGAPLGEGWLDAATVLARVRKRRRIMNALIELWVLPEATYQETVAKEDRWVRMSMQYARKMLGRPL